MRLKNAAETTRESYVVSDGIIFIIWTLIQFSVDEYMFRRGIFLEGVMSFVMVKDFMVFCCVSQVVGKSIARGKVISLVQGKILCQV